MLLIIFMNLSAQLWGPAGRNVYGFIKEAYRSATTSICHIHLTCHVYPANPGFNPLEGDES